MSGPSHLIAAHALPSPGTNTGETGVLFHVLELMVYLK